MMKSERLFGGLVLVLALCLATPSLAEDLALVDVSSAAVRWEPQGGNFEKVELTVSLPNGNVIRREFKGGQPVVFELSAAAKDGVYAYELRGVPRIDASVRKELMAARKAGNEAAVIQRLRDAGSLPAEAVQSGSFSVHEGSIVSPDQVEPRRKPAASGNGPQVITAADQVIPDDLIVQGSTCVGFDCVNNESFGFDTIRLKENSTRIKFEDTSTGSFPSNDWQLTANDSASGGANKFSIEDITGSKVPFTITAGAATNSIFVDSTGRLGLRTSTPVLDLHIATSNTPAIRLEQNNSGGFTAQTWDIAGNEANFFVRDVTGGSRLPFRIRPGAPTSSIDIAADGDVGFGTASPATSLHVSRSDGTAKLQVTETNGTGAARTLFNLENNGQVLFRMKDTSQSPTWQFTASNAFQIDNTAHTGVELQVDPDGTLRVNGTAMTVPDYVFDPTYELMPLSELAAFVREQRHLPNIPNAEEIKREGLKLTHFPIQLLEKVEELALYTIEQHKQIEGLAAENSELKARLTALEEQMKKN